MSQITSLELTKHNEQLPFTWHDARRPEEVGKRKGWKGSIPDPEMSHTLALPKEFAKKPRHGHELLQSK